ncbi:MAG: phosphatidylglycerol lysyltransferase domain-containing protein [Oscillospiraceae bacterium]|jgi:hypothetical protein|nr:phosphatidylglycerol lysyltransferase domain-containing protein [Oscillospiraceae bacterium]
MLSFRPLGLSDAGLVRLVRAGERLCDFTPCVLLMWRDYFHTEIAHEDGLAYLRQTFSGICTAFCFPKRVSDAGNPEEGIRRILAHCAETGERPVFCNVAAGELEFLRARFAVIRENAARDWFDYLYDAPSFAGMAGRRYAGQRNHIHKFEAAFPDWRYEEIGAANFADCAAFLRAFYSRRENEEETSAFSGMLYYEQEKLFEILANYGVYGLSGGILRGGGGRVLALSMGGVLGDTLFVHTEKADIGAPGAYQMIAREFARRHTDVSFINREEDMGIPGLRTSKLSYHPLHLIEKYTVELG